MPEHVRCLSCDTTLLAFRSLGANPLNYDDCPNCGGSEFEFV